MNSLPDRLTLLAVRVELDGDEHGCATALREAAKDIRARSARLARLEELWRMVENSKDTLNSAISITWVEWMDAAMTPADEGKHG